MFNISAMGVWCPVLAFVSHLYIILAETDQDDSLLSSKIF